MQTDGCFGPGIAWTGGSAGKPGRKRKTVYMKWADPTVSSEVEVVEIAKTKVTCAACESYAASQARKPVAVMCCEGGYARKTMELAGFRGFQHLKLAEMGFKKGETTVTPARVREVADREAALMVC